MINSVDICENKTPDMGRKILGESEGKRIVQSLLSTLSPIPSVELKVMSYWTSNNKWGRNKVTISSDTQDVIVSVTRNYDHGRRTQAVTNQIDEVSLKGVAGIANFYGNPFWPAREPDTGFSPRQHALNEGAVWSDLTYNRAPGENANLIATLTRESKERKFLSAGYLEAYAGSLTWYTRDKWGNETTRFTKLTQAQCSATVRTTDGTSSGWAGASSYDLAHIDGVAIAMKALDKCVAGLNPVRIEPGRYTTILEPTASAEFFKLVVNLTARRQPEMFGIGNGGPFAIGYDKALERYRTKLGLKVIDERISITHDPMDPRLGTLGYPGLDRIEYVVNGVLTALTNNGAHASNELTQDTIYQERESFRVDGGSVPIEEMIASTKRGLLVTRLWGIEYVDISSVLVTGTTRDGLWLIENGVITKAVRNFRFTESPFFVLNNVDLIGESVPVFNPVNRRSVLSSPKHFNAIASISVPALKVNDFSFTSTIDAI